MHRFIIASLVAPLAGIAALSASAQGTPSAVAPAAAAPIEVQSPYRAISAERPALAGPLARVVFGQKWRTAKARTRGFQKSGTTLSGEIDGHPVRILAPHGRVSEVVLYLPEQNAAAVLEGLWGKTDVVRVRTTTMRRWLDGEKNVRATLRDTRDANLRGYDELSLTPFVPLEALVGVGPGPFAFEAIPLLGQTRAAVRKAFPAVEWQRKGKVTPRVYLSPTAYSPSGHVLALDLVDGRVGGFSMELSYAAHAPDKAAILAAFERKLGPSVFDADPMKNTTTYKFKNARGVQLVLEPPLKRYRLIVKKL